MKMKLLLICFTINCSLSFGQVYPIYKKKANVVIGQKDFTNNQTNQGQGNIPGPNTLRNPGQTLIVNGKLLICDGQNNRVLLFNSIPTQNNASADIVIGQKDLITMIDPPCGPIITDRPSGLAYDGKRLFVLDRDHYRVLIFNQLPDSNGISANQVLGQIDLFSDTHGGEEELGDTIGMSSSRFSSGATGMEYDSTSGKLLVYDSDNNRVMIFDSVPSSINGISASILIGQPRWTTNLANQGGTPGANTLDLSTANGIAVYKGKIVIADRLNNRILVYNKFPTKNNENADVVIGQDNFISNSKNKGGAISAFGLDGPRCVSVDKYGRLFVTEAGNARILIYDSIPTQNGMPANHVLGQSNFNSGLPSTTDSTFQTFISHVLATEEYLIVSESGNERVLIFNNINLPINVKESVNNDFFEIYPNPAKEKIFVNINAKSFNSFDYEIIQIDGKVIYKGFAETNNFEVKLNYESGLYYFRVSSNDKKVNFIKKIIIN